ncbi:MAG: hypothetical protein SX243_06115 [Acidobacteriota bacterium]|nr:hypothetical protein [Acidobacteriota bacterium]
MLDKLTIQNFQDHVNEEVKVLAGAQTYDFEVVEASEMATASLGESARGPFSVIFRGPQEPILPQAIYRVTHKDLGDLDLFLVPLGPDREGVRYEAVFT